MTRELEFKEARYIDVPATQGRASFHYVIATPSEASATRIDPNLPTVLLFSPTFSGAFAYQRQFRDPQLRQFNLVSFDYLGQGHSRGEISLEYTAAGMAEDAARLMEALSLPACYFWGEALGTYIAIQVATRYPERCRGLVLLSPLCTEEIPEVAHGRRYITDNWIESAQSSEGVDHEALWAAVRAAIILACGEPSPSLFTRVVSNLTVHLALKLWDKDHLTAAELMMYGAAANRRSRSPEELRQLGDRPVAVVYGTADIAYSPEHHLIFVDQLRKADVPVEVHALEGAPEAIHFMRAKEVNSILYDLVVAHSPEFKQNPLVGDEPLPTAFDRLLRVAGWQEDENEAVQCESFDVKLFS
ncbi:Alpha/Beta hydrolase protein [Auriculariales sp. MPI-PUGE-AT-0066]|nr:Alpha/Beta hydrolase protein [Auriculariales sp. MPI-PUGE-AT-0066]